MKIFIGADHRGLPLAKGIMDNLKNMGYDVHYSKVENNENDDYPDFAFDVCKSVLESASSLGILLCGNGIGVSIAANKVKGIRCARVLSEEDAHHAKEHNGANVIAFGGLDIELSMKIVLTFIKTNEPFAERHLKRIQKIIDYENGAYNEL